MTRAGLYQWPNGKIDHKELDARWAYGLHYGWSHDENHLLRVVYDRDPSTFDTDNVFTRPAPKNWFVV